MRRRAPLAPSGERRRRRPARRRRRASRGQALLEYTLITFVILVGFGGVFFAFLPEMLEAYQVYIDSFHFVLNLPIP